MKIRAVITGPAVHEVGYRVFLLTRALHEGIEGFSAINAIDSAGLQQVQILAEGDDDSIESYSAWMREEYPPHARVHSVLVEPYTKRVIRILDYMHLTQVEQLDKGIPAILSIKSTQEKMVLQQEKMVLQQDQMLSKQDQMLDKQGLMIHKQDQTIDEIRALRTDLKGEMNERFNRIEAELQTVKDALHRSGILA